MKRVLGYAVMMSMAMADPRKVSGRPRKVVRNRPASIILGVSNGLRLAATPIFVIMAVIAGIHAGGMQHMLCSATRDTSPLVGMAPMYVLMSIFHFPPWLRLISGPLGQILPTKATTRAPGERYSSQCETCLISRRPP